MPCRDRIQWNIIHWLEWFLLFSVTFSLPCCFRGDWPLRPIIPIIPTYTSYTVKPLHLEKYCDMIFLSYCPALMTYSLSDNSDFQELSSWNSVLSWARVWRGRLRGITHCWYSNTTPDYAGFLATGSLHRELADRSVRNLSCAIPAVLNGIIHISARYVRFPCDAVNQANQSPIFSDSWFSQCNLSDRLHTHCYKGAIWSGMRT